MKRHRFGLARLAAVAAIAFAALNVAPAYAQKKGEQENPPWDVAPMERSAGWVPWVFAFLFLGGTLLMAFKNPHRSHLD